MSQDTQTLDLKAVESYLEAHLPGFKGPIEADKFQRGQSNPTFLLKTPTRNYVLRRKPPGQLLKSAHAVDREFRVQSALAGTDVPVAKMHLLCEDSDVIGSDFYIMDHIDGRNFNMPSLDELEKADRTAVLDDMNRVLAALHDVDIDAVGLSDFGPPGNYYERQIGRWSKQYRASETVDVPAMNNLMQALSQQIPAEDGQRTLVHGDYRIDNMMFEKDGTKCLAILDWELSTIGHPYADLAAVIMQWQMPATPEGRGLAGIDRTARGLPTDAEFVARYCERRGIGPIDNFGFYVAFCFFRMTAIIQGVLKRALDGNASNPERAMQMGQYVPLFAEHGLQALESKG
ncbi:phosphotransferase family protein [Sulfitobacter pseudonitzschiae]|uniref:Phosphotransferase family protein n=1 Tax=Pseudosulfitobacter pseudonitzschiae TaxID=1402135 RepID=A0A9Q2NMR2_9RHOB|nr:phosphotransferase family protein [Pseudosulfitobacter pseudonitzschiae]MBM2290851.1 phosphotransferase family protein [Pseudosulfitobacter pseudonitzschiae]MBM2295769.1 phosphotransferase family protein [Pseudosulfitobacter pseudonitzschiae]MBM2300681.1 phosphotransferase family protein [Pseudosulfitobacter pseudonitzschiae]MBM2310466.1 phosphotransferase family protein [Pseudosulfitobacter pseudonitzschiae]MBM2315378.1 phosphotransferase family protein [Pseudosulfitobacter pseudonitzschia